MSNEEMQRTEKEILKSDKELINYNIFLIGFMGAGKSTVAEELAQLLSRERIEMDEMISEQQKMSIPDIFDKHGEDYFRDLESALLQELQKKGPSIVSCGGGVVVRPENIENMKNNGRVVLLTAEPETVLERVKHSDERPILKNNMNTVFIEELMSKRRDKYLAAADLIVATDNKTVAEICRQIIDNLKTKNVKN